MGKKKSARIKGEPSEQKTAFQLRLDADLHQQLKKAAEDAGISLNQLIQGICWGAVEHLHQGELITERVVCHSEGSPSEEWAFSMAKARHGCLFFGRRSSAKSEEEQEALGYLAKGGTIDGALGRVVSTRLQRAGGTCDAHEFFQRNREEGMGGQGALGLLAPWSLAC